MHGRSIAKSVTQVLLPDACSQTFYHDCDVDWLCFDKVRDGGRTAAYPIWKIKAKRKRKISHDACVRGQSSRLGIGMGVMMIRVLVKIHLLLEAPSDSRKSISESCSYSIFYLDNRSVWVSDAWPKKAALRHPGDKPRSNPSIISSIGTSTPLNAWCPYNHTVIVKEAKVIGSKSFVSS